jgi:hypothetical protein
MGGKLQGFITEQHLSAAEREFPGISRFFAACTNKPRTFLELVWWFETAKRLPQS